MSDLPLPPTPRFSVLIPAFNEEHLLPATLASVHASFQAVAEPHYEIVVCDNNSTDGTKAAAEAHGARVVCEPHNQIARARNTAAAAALGEWLIFLDADTKLNAPLLTATFAALGSRKVCGGGSTIRFGEIQGHLIGTALTGFWNGISRVFRLAAGSYIFCLREGAEAVGGFDTSLYAAEEIAFSRALKRWGRARRLTFRILTAAPIVTSARKMDWHGPWGLLLHILRFTFRPMSIKRREKCDLWYKRPPTT